MSKMRGINTKQSNQIDQLDELSESELSEIVGGTLQDDLNEFLALIPVVDIEILFLDYLSQPD